MNISFFVKEKFDEGKEVVQFKKEERPNQTAVERCVPMN
jgi:hypothetical protein